MGIVLLLSLIAGGLAVLAGLVGCVAAMGRGSTDGLVALFMGFAMAALIVVTGFLGEGGMAGSSRQKVTETIPLASLGNSTRIHGHGYSGMFISRVSIDEEMVYQYMARTPGGGYTAGEISAKTEVRQDATAKTARIETVQCTYDRQVDRTLWGACGPAKTTIHVPEGSIVEDFTIDMTQAGGR